MGIYAQKCEKSYANKKNRKKHDPQHYAKNRFSEKVFGNFFL
jgi:hypothetical protein